MEPETEYNENTYSKGKGLFLVPLVLLYQKFVYLYYLIPWQVTDRYCLIPRLYPTQHEEWKRKGVYYTKGYYTTFVKGILVGLHTLFWIAANMCYPSEGKSSSQTK